MLQNETMQPGSDKDDIIGMSDDSTNDPSYNKNMDADERSSDSDTSGVCKSKTHDAPHAAGDTNENEVPADANKTADVSDTLVPDCESDAELPDLPYTHISGGRDEELNVTIVPTQEDGDKDGDSDDPDDPNGLSNHLPQRRCFSMYCEVHFKTKGMQRKKKPLLESDKDDGSEGLEVLEESVLANDNVEKELFFCHINCYSLLDSWCIFA